MELDHVKLSQKKCRAFENFLRSQKKFIEDSKWYQGEKICKDPGDEYILDWVNREAANFRKRWEVSQCKECMLGDKCGDLLKTVCIEFKEIEINN
jgi:hypothetical protein